jgi:hypothetical protein
VGVVVVGGRFVVAASPQSVREPPRGGAPRQREERWPRAAPYGLEVAVLGGFSSLF